MYVEHGMASGPSDLAQRPWEDSTVWLYRLSLSDVEQASYDSLTADVGGWRYPTPAARRLC